MPVAGSCASILGRTRSSTASGSGTSCPAGSSPPTEAPSGLQVQSARPPSPGSTLAQESDSQARRAACGRRRSRLRLPLGRRLRVWRRRSHRPAHGAGRGKASRRRLAGAARSVGFGSVWVNDDKGRVLRIRPCRPGSGFSLGSQDFRAIPEETNGGGWFDRASVMQVPRTAPKGVRLMRRLVLLVPLAIVRAIATTLASAAARPAPQVELQPAVAADSASGRPSPSPGFTPVHSRCCSPARRRRSGTNPQAAPVAYRSIWSTAPGAARCRRRPCPASIRSCSAPARARLRSGRRPLFLRVFAPGTGARPSFANPVDVVRWWVRTVPHAKLVALKAWPRPGFDLRDLRLHRLFVVAYSPPGHPQVRDRLGMFVTAVRDGYGATLAAPRGNGSAVSAHNGSSCTSKGVAPTRQAPVSQTHSGRRTAPTRAARTRHCRTASRTRASR